MAKGKYKRKKHDAQQKAQKSAAHVVVVERIPVAENTDKGDKRNGDANGQQKRSRWWLVKEYVKSNSSFTDWCIVFFTAALAAVAFYQYFITASQLDVMRKDERAWIAVIPPEPKDIQFAVGTALSIPITVINIGKTPATDIAGDLYVELIPNGDTPQFEYQGIHIKPSTGLLIPNGTFPVAVERQRTKEGGSQVEPDAITTAEAADWVNGKSWMAEYGMISYRDIFGTQHWIKQCSWFGAKGIVFQAQSCTAYNSTDKN